MRPWSAPSHRSGHGTSVSSAMPPSANGNASANVSTLKPSTSMPAPVQNVASCAISANGIPQTTAATVNVNRESGKKTISR